MDVFLFDYLLMSGVLSVSIWTLGIYGLILGINTHHITFSVIIGVPTVIVGFIFAYKFYAAFKAYKQYKILHANLKPVEKTATAHIAFAIDREKANKNDTFEEFMKKNPYVRNEEDLKALVEIYNEDEDFISLDTFIKRGIMPEAVKLMSIQGLLKPFVIVCSPTQGVILMDGKWENTDD